MGYLMATIVPEREREEPQSSATMPVNFARE